MNEETEITSKEYPEDSIRVSPNEGDRSNNSLYLELLRKTDVSFEDMSVSIQGEDDIMELLTAIAYHGGLLEEGGSLTLSIPKTMPEDGIYVLDETESGHKSVAFVRDGRLFVPQVKNDYSAVLGVMNDLTEEYLNDSSIKLSEMKIQEHV